jgi:hypothetical protein
MATADVDFELDLPASEAWDLIADFGAPARIAPDFVRECKLEGIEGIERIVTFQSGTTARERLVTRDPARRRLTYFVTGGRFEHHNASMQVMPLGCARSAIRWTADLLPDELGPTVQSMMEEGARAIVAEQQRQREAAGKPPRQNWFT